MQTKTREKPKAKCCVVEQKAESKGRSERRVRKVAEEHIVVCGMQLEMVAGEKKQGCAERLLEKKCRMMCDCMAELGVDRKMDVASNKSKDDTKTAVKQTKHKQSMYKKRQPLFTGCNGPVCAQHGWWERRWRQRRWVTNCIARRRKRGGNMGHLSSRKPGVVSNISK